MPEHDAAVARVQWVPASEGLGGVEVGETQVGGALEGSSEGRGGVRRLRWVEYAEEEAEQGCPVGAAEAALEGGVGHDAAEGRAGCGGSPDVGEVRQAEEDVRKGVAGEAQNRWRGVDDLGRGAGLRRRRRGVHLLRVPNPNHLQQKDPLGEKTRQNLALEA